MYFTLVLVFFNTGKNVYTTLAHSFQEFSTKNKRKRKTARKENVITKTIRVQQFSVFWGVLYTPNNVYLSLVHACTFRIGIIVIIIVVVIIIIIITRVTYTIRIHTYSRIMHDSAHTAYYVVHVMCI